MFKSLQHQICQITRLNYITDVVLPLLMYDRIAYVHLSPSGRHAIISTAGADNFYLNLKHDSAKQLKKLKVKCFYASQNRIC